VRSRHQGLYRARGNLAVKPQAKTNHTPKRTPPTPEVVLAEQKRLAEKATAATKAALPAKAAPIAVAVPDNRNSVQRYLDETAPASIVGRMLKFSKEGKFVTADDEEEVSSDVDFIALCDQTLVGWMRFHEDGSPPDRAMGLLYDGFQMPDRATLGDDDQSLWQAGLDGQPTDPWQHFNYLVLQRGDTGELFTFTTSSKTGRRAVGNLLHHYNRMQKTNADMFPVVKLKTGGYDHKDPRVGWVNTPVFAVVGRAPRDSAAKPDSSLRGDMGDQIPF
jgi:hypothetical protein